MSSITLNKPSGGQLTLTAEDGATNETVTIPSNGLIPDHRTVEFGYGDAWSTSTTSTSFVTVGSWNFSLPKPALCILHSTGHMKVTSDTAHVMIGFNGNIRGKSPTYPNYQGENFYSAKANANTWSETNSFHSEFLPAGDHTIEYWLGVLSSGTAYANGFTVKMTVIEGGQ